MGDLAGESGHIFFLPLLDLVLQLSQLYQAEALFFLKECVHLLKDKPDLLLLNFQLILMKVHRNLGRGRSGRCSQSGETREAWRTLVDIPLQESALSAGFLDKISKEQQMIPDARGQSLTYPRVLFPPWLSRCNWEVPKQERKEYSVSESRHSL